MESTTDLAYTPYSTADIPTMPSVGRIPIPFHKEDIFEELHARGFLEALLVDRTTERRVIWATDTYSDLGPGFGREEEICATVLRGRHDALAAHRLKRRAERTRRHGEVATPRWVCKKMCDHACEELFHSDWRRFVEATVLEITCGEAPFLVSRRDLSTGEPVPIEERIGLLDRKLHVVDTKATDREDWLKWTVKAFQATYGYELQGDNVLLARINLFKTFEEYYRHRWTFAPTIEECRHILEIISWNLWQMDGLTGMVPCSGAQGEDQGNLLAIGKPRKANTCCFIRDWKAKKKLMFLALGRRK